MPAAILCSKHLISIRYELIDSGNAQTGMISKIAKSTVRSLYSLFAEFPERLKLHLQTSLFAKEHSEVLLSIS
jgi:hypothetical protein